MDYAEQDKIGGDSIYSFFTNVSFETNVNRQ